MPSYVNWPRTLVTAWRGDPDDVLIDTPACDAARSRGIVRFGVAGVLLVIVDDVNCGLLSRGCAPVDTDVISQQFCLYVLAKPPVRRDQATGSLASNLLVLRKFALPLGFVGSLQLVLVVQVVDVHRRIGFFLGKELIQAFVFHIEGASVRPLGRGISLVEYVVDATIDEGVRGLKLVVGIEAVFACSVNGTIRTVHHLTMPQGDSHRPLQRPSLSRPQPSPPRCRHFYIKRVEQLGAVESA